MRLFNVVSKPAAKRHPLESIPKYLLRPISFLPKYDRSQLRPDLIAGLTIAVILLPQAIAYALIAELPPQMGIYTAIVGAVVGALWGSSNQAQTGPTNAVSLLVLSTLIVSFTPGSPAFILAAGLLALMAGVFQLGMGFARLGMLLTFVSHSVVVGFSAGAGILIAIRQIAPLLGLQISAHGLSDILIEIVRELSETQLATALLGIGVIVLILVLKKINPRIPAAFIAMIAASLVVFVFNLDEKGVLVIGKLPKGLPPLTDFSQFNLTAIPSLFTGALAIGIIGLVETMAISRTIATKTGQRLDSNQEFVGQGLANLAAGMFSGYACSGSFTRSAVNHNAGGRSPIAAASSGLFVLISMFFMAPMAAYLPRTALAGVLIIVSIGMINRADIVRIWQGARGDAVIMLVTFLATLFLDLAIAVFIGIVLSFALYIMRTSVPRVQQVLPDEGFKHFTYQPERPVCPQLGVIDILGSIYFGAVNHVEEAILRHQKKYPEQRFLLIRMHNVNHCDFSGIHMLESIVRNFRDRGGDVFMVRVGYSVDILMTSTGFYDLLSQKNFLPEDSAISYLFYRKLDPAVCIYECPVRIFKECQNLPKRLDLVGEPLHLDQAPTSVDTISAEDLWVELHKEHPPIIVDVREPREYKAGHIPEAVSIPLPKLLSDLRKIHRDEQVIFVCRSGRRSTRVAGTLIDQGYEKIKVLRGGMLSWEAANLLEALDLS
ncbi:MAG: SulP family inorganic anion transporter [Chloroflexota bacterium]|nr:SulP family inorganic anion transporter [Chloroflexota bacterium]